MTHPAFALSVLAIAFLLLAGAVILERVDVGGLFAWSLEVFAPLGAD